MMFKRWMFFFLLNSIAIVGALSATQADDIYENAIATENRVFLATWPYEFQKNDILFETNFNFFSTLSADIEKRFKRMIHIPYMTESQIEITVNRIKTLMLNSGLLKSFIQSKIAGNFKFSVTIQHISVYGSYLYNTVDPDDIDLFVIITSPQPFYKHFNSSSKKVFGANNSVGMPHLSFTVLDYNTYLKTKYLVDVPSTGLTKGELIAAQQLTSGSNWFLSIYGFDFRHNRLPKLSKHMKANLLNTAFNLLNTGGSRLYKSPLTLLFFSTEQARLKKVVSRILTTDYIVYSLDKTLATPFATYQHLYQELDKLDESNELEVDILFKKIESLYLDKLKSLIFLAEKYNKADYLISSPY